MGAHQVRGAHIAQVGLEAGGFHDIGEQDRQYLGFMGDAVFFEPAVDRFGQLEERLFDRIAVLGW